MKAIFGTSREQVCLAHRELELGNGWIPLVLGDDVAGRKYDKIVILPITSMLRWSPRGLVEYFQMLRTRLPPGIELIHL